MPDDVIVAKSASIERAVRRAKEEYAAAGENFAVDRTRQDAATLNVQRACETAIDLAQHWVRIRSLGVPASSRDLFTLLESAAIIDPALAQSLRKMVGFRNVAVHEYQRLDLSILASIIERELDQVLRFASVALRAS
jgi:uncharacterized protein YutE (UPF0331/DUF86 family)